MGVACDLDRFYQLLSHPSMEAPDEIWLCLIWTSGSLEMVDNDGHRTPMDGRQISSLREPKGSGGLNTDVILVQPVFD